MPSTGSEVDIEELEQRIASLESQLRRGIGRLVTDPDGHEHRRGSGHSHPLKAILLNKPGTQFGSVLPNLTAAGIDTIGLLSGLTTTGTLVAGADTDGVLTIFRTGIVVGNQAGMGGTNTTLQRRWNCAALFKFFFSSLTSVRQFIGLSDQTLATMVGSDNPAGNYIGVQFSTPRGDNVAQFVTKDGTTQQLQSTGYFIDTMRYLRITARDVEGIAILADSSVKLELLDGDFNALSEYTFTTNLPGRTVGLGVVAGNETETTLAREFYLYFAHVLNTYR